MNRPHHKRALSGPRNRSRRRAGGERHHHEPVPLNSEGVPAAVPDGPRPSGVVFVCDESLARYPWLPTRVIVGSVWRGPGHERVRVDESGAAQPWRCAPASAR